MRRDIPLNSKIWTVKYAVICALFYGSFCCTHAYASVYLLDRGFTNTMIGILLAVANIVSVLIQPVVAGFIDGPGAVTNRRVLIASSSLVALGSILLMFIKNGIVGVFVIFTMIYLIQMAFQPIVVAIYFEYEALGVDIYFGLARGLGSAGFAVVSVFLGPAVERYGSHLTMIVNVVIMILFAIAAWSFREPSEELTSSAHEKEPLDAEKSQDEGVAHNNIFEFIRLYPKFMLFIVGTMCFFFVHNMINDFMIQIVRDLGGAESDLGYATCLQAILELPIMAVSMPLIRKFTANRLIIFSGLFFFIKAVILIVAGGMGLMYVSQFCQIFAYGLFIPVSAYYVNQEMQVHDRVKGQAYLNCAFAIGGVFSNVISGRILDVSGSKTMLTVGSLVCLVGVVIAYFAVCRGQKQKEALS